jgi:D-alanyl-D-alanine carboxypeptidase
MRLFVYGLGVTVWIVFMSVNFVSTNSATANTVVRDESQCSFEPIDVPASISADAWQITDIETGEVLAEHQSDVIFPFASVVKLLTAYAVLEQADASTNSVVLTYADILTEGRSGSLEVFEEYSPHELLSPLLVTSSNDAGAALARTYPDLLSVMQKFANEAGASATTIADTTGLSRRNTTTAHDLALLLRSLYRQSPHIFDITRTPQIISQYDTGWVNNIPFRQLAGYQGGKQGYLPEVGQTGVAVFTVGEEASKSFSITILSSAGVAKDMEALHRAVVQSYSCAPKLAVK